MSGKIEFRVHGKDSPQVAEELAHRLRTWFKAKPVVQKEAPAADDSGDQKFDPGFVYFVVSIAFTAGIEAFKAVIDEKKASVKKWQDLIDWARDQRPTTILALIDTDRLVLHESEAEHLHRLTRKTLDQVNVVPVPE